MALTPAQLATLKAAILADATLNAFPQGSDGAFAIKDLLNLPSTPVVTVWASNVSTNDLFDAVDFTKYTPTDSADNTTTYLNRTILAQVKQINLQLMLQGRDRINANKANIRAGLRDAVIQLPTGAGGAFSSAAGASGVTLLTACTRIALRIEAILSGADATTGTVTAKLIGFEGQISYQDVQAARES